MQDYPHDTVTRLATSAEQLHKAHAWFQELHTHHAEPLSKGNEDKTMAIVEEAIKFAEESPLPEKHELYEDVYVTPDYPFVKD